MRKPILRRRDLRFAAVSTLLLVSLATVAGAEPAARYHEEVLDNGLRVALIERHEVPMVAFTAIVGAGSALESEDFSGASHFLEHLLFNGTTTMTQEELYDIVDRVGGYNNATTGEDHTAYIMLVPAADAELGLEVQAAMLYDSTLPAEKLEKERKIVLEELAKELATPGDATRKALRQALSPTTAWGRPVVGTETSLAGIGLDRIRTYYERQYVPNNIVLVVVGDFDRDEMMTLVRAHHGSRSRGKEVATLTDPFLGNAGGMITRIALDETTVSVAVRIPAPGPCEPGGREAEILADVLGSEAGPLRRVISPERASRLSASYVPRQVGSALEIDAELAADADPDAVVHDLLQVLTTIGQAGLGPGGLDPVEILRVSRSGRSQALLMGQRIHYFGMLLADAVGACDGELETLVAPRENDVIEPGAVAATARLLAQTPSVARVAVAGPLSTSSGPTPVGAIEASGGSIDEPTHATFADLDRTLANGLRVLVQQEDGAAVTGFHVLIRDRSAREPPGRDGIADLLHRMLPNGTAISDRAQLSARLERIGADLKTADSDYIPYDDYYTSSTHSFVRLEVPSDGWLPALDLLAELVLQPRLDPGELDSLRQARIDRATKTAASPVEQGRRAYRTTLLGPDHPEAKAIGGTAETIAAITAEELRSFSVDYLDPAGLILSAVGPAEPEDLFGAIAERFGGASPPSDRPSIPPWPLTQEPGPPVFRELGGEQARVALGRIAAIEPQDAAALRLLAGLLSDRMARTLREEKGLAYRLGASVAIGADRAWMTASVGTRPENVEAVVEGLKTEMSRLRAEMADDDEIDRVRAVQQSRSLMRRMTAVNRARGLGLRAFTGVAPADDPESVAALDAVGRETLERLAREWLDPDRFQLVVVR